ncbi:hypothetical protein TWF481_001790 [Arthrobotrys musiformis]|uniref:Uncharacterized protein n=1 Tax=Arthrobotrys musiformis TaxID=47236 RepID=A0AAV9VWQ5_9PEZI
MSTDRSRVPSIDTPHGPMYSSVQLHIHSTCCVEVRYSPGKEGKAGALPSQPGYTTRTPVKSTELQVKKKKPFVSGTWNSIHPSSRPPQSINARENNKELTRRDFRRSERKN